MHPSILPILQVLVFIMGVTSIVLAVRWFMFFSKVQRDVATSMRFLMIEQMITSTGTMIFAFNSMVGSLTGEDALLWNNISPEIAIALRAIMFGGMIHSTLHLSLSVQKILRKEVAQDIP